MTFATLALQWWDFPPRWLKSTAIKISRPRMYRHQRIMRIMDAEKVIQICSRICCASRRLPQMETKLSNKRSPSVRSIADFIAGMTDRCRTEHACFFNVTPEFIQCRGF